MRKLILSLIFLFCTPPALAGPVQSNALRMGGRAPSIAFPRPTIAGDLILFAFDYPRGPAPLGISDNQGNTFVRVGSPLTTPGGAVSYVYCAQNIKGGADTVTLWFAAAPSPWSPELYLSEY